MDTPSVEVEIVFAQPNRAIALTMSVPSGATVGDALTRTAENAQFAGIELFSTAVGIFGRTVGRDQVLKQGDRVEIYRPLAADPKLARRKRAASKSGRS